MYWEHIVELLQKGVIVVEEPNELLTTVKNIFDNISAIPRNDELISSFFRCYPFDRNTASFDDLL